MAEQDSAPGVDLYHVAHIVSSYVRHHQVAADQLAGLIVEVHRTLAGLGRVPPAQEPPRPAVPTRRSVQQDYIVCLECGFRAQMLRRHLRVAHGLDVVAYRIRWNLPADYPVTAPVYSTDARRWPRRCVLGAVASLRKRARRQPNGRRARDAAADRGARYRHKLSPVLLAVSVIYAVLSICDLQVIMSFI